MLACKQIGEGALAGRSLGLDDRITHVLRGLRRVRAYKELAQEAGGDAEL